MNSKKDERRFAELMAALGEAFDKTPSPAKIEIYFRALADLTIDQVSQACSNLIKTRTITGTFPLAAEIIAAAGVTENLDDKAQLAWSKFLWTYKHIGPGNSIAFDDPLIHHVIMTWTGGWIGIHDLDWRWEQIPWRQKEFVSLYKAIARQTDKPNPPAYLPGEYERDNAQRGFTAFIPVPLLITGNTGQYKAVKSLDLVLAQIEQDKMDTTKPNLTKLIEHFSGDSQ